MAIYYPYSTFVRSSEEPLAAGVTLSAAGQALVQSVTAGQYGVAPSTGVAGEIFVGFSNTETSMASFQQGTTSKVEEHTLSGAGTCQLSSVPVAGTLFVFDITAGAPVAAGYTVDAAGVVTYAAGAGHALRFTFTQTLSVLQARARFGDTTPGGYAGYIMGQVGVARSGVIYVDQYDTSVDWSAVPAGGIKLGANGKLTTAGTGTAINGFVKAIPTVTHPYLGIDFVTA